MKRVFTKVVLLIAILLLVPLGRVSANMGVPFGYASSPTNPIVNPKNVISVTEEYITFEVSGTTTAVYLQMSPITLLTLGRMAHLHLYFLR